VGLSSFILSCGFQRQLWGRDDSPSLPPALHMSLAWKWPGTRHETTTACSCHPHPSVFQPLRLTSVRFGCVHDLHERTSHLPQPPWWHAMTLPIGHMNPKIGPRGLPFALSQAVPPMRETSAELQSRSPPRWQLERLMPSRRPDPSGGLAAGRAAGGSQHRFGVKPSIR
jgi:hypothetical protein